jgi:hypothetical protein
MKPERFEDLKRMLNNAYKKRAFHEKELENLKLEIHMIEEMIMYAGLKISDEEFADVFKGIGFKESKEE